MHIRATATVLALALVGVLAVGTGQAALVYEYDAAQDANGTGDNSWQPNINTSLARDWSLSNQSFVPYTPGVNTAYSGITGAYSFTGSGSGGSTT